MSGAGGPPALILPPEEAVVIALVRSVIAEWFRRNWLDPQGLASLLARLDDYAALCRPATSSEPVAEVGSEVTRCEWITAHDASERLGISTRAVVKALESGRIVGRKKGRGRGVWEVDADSVERYRQTRIERTAS